VPLAGRDVRGAGSGAGHQGDLSGGGLDGQLTAHRVPGGAQLCRAAQVANGQVGITSGCSPP
jgi:hypothetical protein